MFTPTKEQEAVINHINGHSLVIAGPGSGKTTTLIHHLKTLLSKGEITQEDLWVMAFNRDIAFSLRENTQKVFEENKIPRITTIHGYVLEHMIKHGSEFIKGYDIVEIALGNFGRNELLWKQLSVRLKEVHRITAGNKRLNVKTVENMWKELRVHWLTGEPITNSQLEKLEYELSKLSQKYGLIFFDQLAIKFLEILKANPEFMKAVKKKKFYIDEFQDLNPVEHSIVTEFIKGGTDFMVLGDDDQAINDFRMASAVYVDDFANTHNPTIYPLARDRRCPKEILDLADTFLKGMKRFKKSPGNASHKGTVDILSFKNDELEIVGIGDLVKKYLDTHPENEKKPQVLILCSSTGKLRGTRIPEIISQLNSIGITDVSGGAEPDPLDCEYGFCFKALLNMIVSGISSVHLASLFLTCYTGIFKEIDEYISKEEKKGKSINFVVAARELSRENERLRNLMDKILQLKATSEEEFLLQNLFDFFECDDPTEVKIFIQNAYKEIKSNSEIPNNLVARKLLDVISKQSEEGRKKQISTVHVTTYGKSKGLEADLVVVSGADTAQFGVSDSDRRLLYVAATRAKKALVITFASRRTGARVFSRSRRPIPAAYRTSLIPSNYSTTNYTEDWLKEWKPE